MKQRINNGRQPTNSGVTLVEILLVIVIMSVLSALIIPRVRTVNKDRNIRETARVVGSMLSNASQRAVVDGKAGVVIQRNQNFVDGLGNQYAGRTLYLMRAVTDWSGDSKGDVAIKSPDNVGYIRVPLPINQTPDNEVVSIGDRCFLNHQDFAYAISDVKEEGDFLDLRLQSYSGPGSVSVSVYPAPRVLTDDSIPPPPVSYRT